MKKKRMDLQKSNEEKKILLAEKEKQNFELEKQFGEIKQEFEYALKKKFELDVDNKNFSKKLEKFNGNIKFNKEMIKTQRQEEIKNLQAQVFYEIN